MRKLLAVLGVVGLCGVGGGAASAQDTIEIYGWQMQVVGAGENTGFCQMSAMYRSNIELGFVNYFSGDGGFTFYNSEWNIPDGAQYDVEWRVDRSPWYAGVASEIGENGVFVFSRSFGRHVPLLRKGQRLTVRTGAERFTFNLTNTFKALPLLQRCAHQQSVAFSNNNPGRGGSPSFGTPRQQAGAANNAGRGANTATSGRLVRLEMVPVAVNLFAEAGIPIRIQTEEERRAEGFHEESPYLTGSIGLSKFIMGRFDRSVDKRMLMRDQLGSFAAQCEGSFSEAIATDTMTRLPEGLGECLTDQARSNVQLVMVEAPDYVYIIALITVLEAAPASPSPAPQDPPTPQVDAELVYKLREASLTLQ
ncbi:MAG: hypothetical protein ACPGOY_05260 [Rhodospirillaceae bacterium]